MPFNSSNVMHHDSTGQEIIAGDIVIFRRHKYTIYDFRKIDKGYGEFKDFEEVIMMEEMHTKEMPTEMNVDLLVKLGDIDD